MKIEKANLKKALETVKPGLASKELIEQSTSFCFIDGKVVTYNDEISISTPVKDLNLTGAVNATELYNFINKVQSKEIDLEINESEILLKAGRAKVGLTLHSEIKLPIEEIGKIEKWKKLPDGFVVALNFAAGACSRDMLRPVLTCVNVNKTSIQGSDSFRIIDYQLEKKVPVNSFLLPANSCMKVVKLLPDEIAEGKRWIHFKKDETILSCRTFDDKYPDISEHMQVEGSKIEFPKELSDILDKAGVFAKRDYQLDESVNLLIEKGKIQVKSDSASGWFTEKTKINYTGENIEFSITPYLLTEILKETMSGIIGDGKLLFEHENWKYMTILRD